MRGAQGLHRGLGTEVFRTEVFRTEVFRTEVFRTEVFRTEVFRTRFSAPGFVVFRRQPRPNTVPPMHPAGAPDN